ncbi:ABC transporter ATP-binding protein [Oceanibacterium hippocampi]|uniref:Oligopeptide transport ATP-binding protein OppF n=1 Tax=Oceanibacterium hippocampi TaxID=745714 RepID=A0A1Y5RAC5_9PROT|nr:dipeptide ABC transporter ATP-binding protein [Oceanibacterium hippocampi]SLN12110.1 Oligopeptide transport ATP-binding protein OppF [Oceanibacterium hippocampi]
MNAPATVPVLAVEELQRHYTLPREHLFREPGKVYALNGVSFEIQPGRSFGVVGESGCGKSTLARTVMALETPTAGTVRILGHDLFDLDKDALRALRRHFQMVFQDPYGSLDPRHKVGRVVAEPLTVSDEVGARDRVEKVADVLRSVGLKAADMDKYPHEFSGGQRQRIAIARALVTRPELIVADEPVSALDVSVQAQVLNLMRDLQDSFGVTYMLISHDLAVVEYVCDEVAVMYLGRIVERGRTEALFARPSHPYTRALLDAVPRPGVGRAKRGAALKGTVMSQTALGTGCAFADRCPMAKPRCLEEAPPLRDLGDHHLSACHYAEDVPAG